MFCCLFSISLISVLQTATLLNDLGTVYEQKKNYKKAMEMVCRAEKLAQDSPDNLAVILCNKASLLLRNGKKLSSR